MILYFSIFLSVCLYFIIIAYFANNKLVFFKNTIIGLSSTLISLFILNILNPYKNWQDKLLEAMVLIIPFIISIMCIVYFRGLKVGESINFKDPKIIIIISLIILNLMILFIFSWKTYSERTIKNDIKESLDDFLYSFDKSKDNLDQLIF